MQMNRKIIMASVAAIIGIGSIIGINAATPGENVVYASVYKTTGNNKVKVVKSTSFVNNRGVKQSISAEKGGSYTVYAVNYIDGVAYVSVHKSNRYWLPVSAVKGKLFYQRGRDNATYMINAGNNSDIVSLQTNNKGNVTLKSNAYVYNSKGKRVNNDLGKYFITKGASIPYYGIKTIAGKKYYYLGNGQYIKAKNVDGTGSIKAHVEVAPRSSGATPTDYSKPTLTLKSNAYPYNLNGERINNYLGFTYIKKGATLNYQGSKRINGQNYYYIGDGAYIKNTTVGSTNNTNAAHNNTITLNKKIYVYTASGKKMSKYLGYTYINKGTTLNYYGTKNIKGKTFYYIGDHAYVNAANVGKVTNE